jgi:hypothetical protein
VLEVLVSATQDSNNEVEHQNQVHQKEEDLVVFTNAHDHGQIFSLHQVLVLEHLHVPLAQTGLEEVDEHGLQVLEVFKLTEGKDTHT